jgi:hypothetical protein
MRTLEKEPLTSYVFVQIEFVVITECYLSFQVGHTVAYICVEKPLFSYSAITNPHLS